MKELKEKIRLSGLKQKFIADKVGISEPHLTMMLSGAAKMQPGLRVKIEMFLNKYLIDI